MPPAHGVPRMLSKCSSVRDESGGWDSDVILAGDIGGTNARIAFFEVEQRRLRCIHEHVYPTHEHPNLESAIASFIGEYRAKPIDRMLRYRRTRERRSQSRDAESKLGGRRG